MSRRRATVGVKKSGRCSDATVGVFVQSGLVVASFYRQSRYWVKKRWEREARRGARLWLRETFSI